MKNKESFVVIPKYLFDEVIEYLDNKSDADNGTPNKEMQLLSQLQDELMGDRLSESNSTDELIKEVERLKGSIKQLWIATRNEVMTNSQLESRWAQFKETHKL